MAHFVLIIEMDIPRNFIAKPFEYHQEIEFTVEDMTSSGSGVGRVNGWVVMVPFVIRGEKVKGRIFRNFSNYSEADLVEVIEPSPKRVEPICPLFQTCGGCQYQHVEYSHQLTEKMRRVEVLMKKLGPAGHRVESPIPSPRAYHYRSKITPHYNKPEKDGSQPIGFLRHGRRRQVVDVPHCPIATDAINEVLPQVRKEARAASGKKRRRRGGTLLLREVLEGVVSDPEAIVF